MSEVSLLDFLNGKAFNHEARFDFSHILPPNPIYRVEALVRLAQNKRVVHVGCLDHKELIEAKICNGSWLHGIITKCARHCIGIDNNLEALEFVKEKYKIDNVYCLDLLKTPINTVDSSQFDLLMLAEVLEHVNNPVLFLQTIKQLNPEIPEMIVTVPNVFHYLKHYYAENNIEYINSDHKYWFTPYTLHQVLHQAGFTNVQMSLVDYSIKPEIAPLYSLMHHRADPSKMMTSYITLLAIAR